jgi:sugar/nucleoside kinase (ribokinase family)
MRYDVSVVGLYILDVLGRPVERIPEGGNVEFIDQIRLTVAGTAGGTVVDCAKLGMRCLAVGAVGQDEKADFVLMTLEQHDIDASQMQRLGGVPTSATILNVRANGERPALHVRGASDHFRIRPEDHSQIFAARFVHLGGTGLLRTLDGEPSRAFLQAAKAAGCTTSFDLIATDDKTIEIVRPLLPHIDYFMPSIEEARDLSGLQAAPDVARFFLDQGVPCAVYTMGEEGSLIATPDGLTQVPALDVEVVDTTGCGDAFCAGFLAARARDWDLEAAARFATAAAALVATGLGSDAGIESFEHTEQAMRRWPSKA